MKRSAFLLAFLFATLTGLSAQIVINEIMYNPPEAGTDTLEYLELYNSSQGTIDLTGAMFTSGIVYTFGNTQLVAGGFLVICKDSVRLAGVLGVSGLEWTTGSLDNSGETIVLKDAMGLTLDSVTYSDSGAWPGLPTDGNGSSLVLCDPTGDHNDPDNWQAASTPTGVVVNGFQVFANPLAPSGCKVAGEQGLLLTGVFDAQPSNAGAKGIEVYVAKDVPDLSLYGVGSANNGGGTDGVEFTFPSGPGLKGDFLYIAADSALFRDFFGFDADFISQAVNINGDDAIELFEDGVTFDIFGEIDMDGSNEPWEYTDGWVYRVNGTGPDGKTFVPANWIYSGVGALTGGATNVQAPIPFPLHTYDPQGNAVLTANDDYLTLESNTVADLMVLANDFRPNPVQVFEILSLPNHGSAVISGESITYEPVVDYCGPDELAYRICDMDGCDTASVFLTITCPKVYPVYPIGLVTTVDASGVVDSLATVCQLEGVVYGVNLRPGGLQITIIDDLGDGIAVFSTADFGYDVHEGDRIITQGRVIQYNGLAEMMPDTVWLVATSQPLFAPQVVTNLDESVESELVKLETMTLVDPSEWTNAAPGFNVRITNGSDTLVMRIDEDVDIFGYPAPTGTFDAIGLVTQFDGSSPYDDGYQLMPRYLPDIGLMSGTTPLSPEDFRIWPNPTRGLVFVDNVPVGTILQVLDLGGRIQDVQISGNDHTRNLDLNDLSPGAYILRGIAANGHSKATLLLLQK